MLLGPSHLSLHLGLALLVQSWERGDPLRPPRRHATLSWQVQFGSLEKGEGVEGKERSLLNVQKLEVKLHVHILICLEISEINA